MKPSVAVILSTYNRPDMLELTLTGLLRQEDRDFRIVVADDGSSEETRAFIERYQAEFPLTHVWHEDKGFRKAKILNAAIRACPEVDMLWFVDQDSIPAHDCLALFREAHAPGRLVPGGYVRLTQEDTARLTVENTREGFYETLLTDERRRFLRKRHRKNLVHRLTGRKNRPRLMGLNFAVCRELVVKVNGFDETYEGWGKEDSDLRTRLRRAGGGWRCLWHRAISFHQWHPVNPTKATMDDNQRRYHDVCAGRLPWRCERGLEGGAVD